MTYEWSRIRDGQQSVLLKSGIQNNGLESYLTLNPLQENIGTYTCRVKNSAGADISCEIEVHAKKGTYIFSIYTDKNISDKSYLLINHFPDFTLWSKELLPF